MYVLEANSNPSRTRRRVDTFIVIPPRSGAFQDGRWIPLLQSALTAAFPELTIRVSLLDAVRDHFEPVVMPIMGTAGTGNIGGRIEPMTQEIEDTKQSIAAAVLAFDPVEPVLN